MAEYRCIFFGESTSQLEHGRSLQTIQAESDEVALLCADALCRVMRRRVQGFEVWQASRLVQREVMRLGDSRRRHDAAKV